MSLEFLYDENTGLFDALQVAIAAGTPVAVVVTSAVGSWTGAAMHIESAETTFAADGIATCTTSLTGSVVFA
jgi:2-succinyl-5-enolpyruvyl-6-hydroxy-3-cyclohexene-1-carboxylate synthase